MIGMALFWLTFGWVCVCIQKWSQDRKNNRRIEQHKEWEREMTKRGWR
jgi:hypothetical protein